MIVVMRRDAKAQDIEHMIQQVESLEAYMDHEPVHLKAHAIRLVVDRLSDTIQQLADLCHVEFVVRFHLEQGPQG